VSVMAKRKKEKGKRKKEKGKRKKEKNEYHQNANSHWVAWIRVVGNGRPYL
jgi:hypothetical protein